jgi:hypothetical protein
LLALPVDSVVNLLGQSISGNWYQISAPDVPAGGWMASNLLETSEDCRLNLPIAP